MNVGAAAVTVALFLCLVLLGFGLNTVTALFQDTNLRRSG